MNLQSLYFSSVLKWLIVFKWLSVFKWFSVSIVHFFKVVSVQQTSRFFKIDLFINQYLQLLESKDVFFTLVFSNSILYFSYPRSIWYFKIIWKSYQFIYCFNSVLHSFTRKIFNLLIQFIYGLISFSIC